MRENIKNETGKTTATADGFCQLENSAPVQWLRRGDSPPALFSAPLPVFVARNVTDATAFHFRYWWTSPVLVIPWWVWWWWWGCFCRMLCNSWGDSWDALWDAWRSKKKMDVYLEGWLRILWRFLSAWQRVGFSKDSSGDARGCLEALGH